MTRALAGLLLLGCLALPPPARAAAVVADAQVLAAGPGAWTLALRSSAPQAFDASTSHNGRRVTIRLHDATLGTLHRLPRATFGRVALRAKHGREVVVRLRLRKGWTATVHQGRSANAVDVRIAR